MIGSKIFTAFELAADTMRYRLRSGGLQRIGTTYGGWWVDTRNLSSSSNVVSAGIGEDISFDTGLINVIGCNIFALDPTPKAIDYATSACSDPRFVFQPY